MLFVLTGQLTFGSLDDACTKNKCFDQACNQIAHCIYTLKCYIVQYGALTTKTFTELPTSSTIHVVFPMVYGGSQSLLVASYRWFSVVLYSFQWLTVVLNDYQVFSMITSGCECFSVVTTESQWLPMVFNG